jgi:hypothetical protein
VFNLTKEMYKIDAGGRYSFLKDKATLSIRFDIFNTMKAGFDGENPYPQRGQFRWESQSVFVGFNYAFGAGKPKTCNANKGKITPNKRRTVLENQYEGVSCLFSYSIVWHIFLNSKMLYQY